MNNEKNPECHICTKNDNEQLRRDLVECRKRGQTKDRQIKELNKKVFILTMIAIGVAAIFGKEALDSITEWIGSINNFRGAAQDMTGSIVPAPGALPLMAIALFATKRPRRRK